MPRRSSRNRSVRELKIATARLHRRQDRDGRFRAIRVPAEPVPKRHVCELVEANATERFGGPARRCHPGTQPVWPPHQPPTEPPMIRNDVAITPELVREHGLKEDEYRRFRALIGREPTLTELGIVSAMWNEHCSYKSSRLHLRTLPTSAPWVIQGPGENAGVIDIGDGLACVFKMESHNHPSFIEPYQGAATGVGGILRDVFTMGARPIAALNALRFGPPDHPKTRHLVAGVVAGIGGYGNSFGVPTVGGEVGFHSRLRRQHPRQRHGRRPREDGRDLLRGGVRRRQPDRLSRLKTGRDGIHGATMASAEFDDASEEKRPTVQVGDPFAEKLLLEACLELMESGAVIAIQDMGAAGLTCSAVEMGAKGDLGVELDLDKVPCREEGMTAYEMMLSESQERMLMVLKPGMEAEAEAIFRKWGLDFAVIGRTTDTLRFVVRHGGETVADLPIKELGDEAPVYDRPHLADTFQPVLAPESVEAPVSNAEALVKLVGSPDLCSKRWVWEQYDHLILGNTVQMSGRRRRDRARRGRSEGPRADDRRDAALLRGRPGRGRQAGGRRGLAQHHRGRRKAARGHRQPQLRQSPSGPRPWASSSAASAASARPAGRSTSRSSPATSRSTTRPTAAASCRRRRSAASACSRIAGSMPPSPSSARATRSSSSARPRGWLGQSVYLREVLGREEGAPPPVDLEAEKTQRRFRAPPDRGAARRHGPRLLRRRPRGRARRDGDGRRRRRGHARMPGRPPLPCLSVRRGPGPLRPRGRPGHGAGHPLQRRLEGHSGGHHRHDRRRFIDPPGRGRHIHRRAAPGARGLAAGLHGGATPPEERRRCRWTRARSRA